MLKNRFKAVLGTLGEKPGGESWPTLGAVAVPGYALTGWVDAAGLLIIFEY